MRRVLVLGPTGMAGHVATIMLGDRDSLEVSNVSRGRFNGSTVLCDVRDHDALEGTFRELRPDVTINCVGVLVKAAERDRMEAIEINSLLPHRLVSLCDKYGGRLVHLSTDCVFSGKNGPYRIDDLRDGDNTYDRTKALGEVDNERDLTIRTSIIGPELRSNGTGLFHWFMNQKGTVQGYSNALWSGVTTVELAKFLVHVCTKRPEVSGLVHLSTQGGISKLDLLRLIGREFGRTNTVEPFDNERIDKRLIPSEDLDHPVPSYEVQIRQMREWMDEHMELYRHYSWG